MFNCRYLLYYMASKCESTTSSGAQLKKQHCIITLQEELALLSLLGEGMLVSDVACNFGHSKSSIYTNKI
jgi:hypothetical protein